MGAMRIPSVMLGLSPSNQRRRRKVGNLVAMILAEMYYTVITVTFVSGTNFVYICTAGDPEFAQDPVSTQGSDHSGSISSGRHKSAATFDTAKVPLC